MNGQNKPVSVRDTADLLAWARRLSETGRSAPAQDTTAYLAATADLLARIHATHPQETP